MAKYTIECDICLGFTHCGAVETSGEGTIELSDEEVKTLVDLIRKKHSTDPGKLRLKRAIQTSTRNWTRHNTSSITKQRKYIG